MFVQGRQGREFGRKVWAVEKPPESKARDHQASQFPTRSPGLSLFNVTSPI